MSTAYSILTQGAGPLSANFANLTFLFMPISKQYSKDISIEMPLLYLFIENHMEDGCTIFAGIVSRVYPEYTQTLTELFAIFSEHIHINQNIELDFSRI